MPFHKILRCCLFRSGLICVRLYVPVGNHWAWHYRHQILAVQVCPYLSAVVCLRIGRHGRCTPLIHLQATKCKLYVSAVRTEIALYPNPPQSRCRIIYFQVRLNSIIKCVYNIVNAYQTWAELCRWLSSAHLPYPIYEYSAWVVRHVPTAHMLTTPRYDMALLNHSPLRCISISNLAQRLDRIEFETGP